MFRIQLLFIGVHSQIHVILAEMYYTTKNNINLNKVNEMEIVESLSAFV